MGWWADLFGFVVLVSLAGCWVVIVDFYAVLVFVIWWCRLALVDCVCGACGSVRGLLLAGCVWLFC